MDKKRLAQNAHWVSKLVFYHLGHPRHPADQVLDGTPLRRTPRGEIAFQLGGADGFRSVQYHEWTADLYWDPEAGTAHLIECNPYGAQHPSTSTRAPDDTR